MMQMKSNENPGWFGKLVKAYEENFFGVMPMMMVGQSCLGSIAALYSLHINNTPVLILGTALTMAVNVAFIAQLKPNWAVKILSASVVINTLLIGLLLFT